MTVFGPIVYNQDIQEFYVISRSTETLLNQVTTMTTISSLAAARERWQDIERERNREREREIERERERETEREREKERDSGRERER